MNNITILGNLGKDPETRQAGDHKITSFAVATTSGSKDKKKTTWHNCQSWDKQGEIIAEYFAKGDQICLSGEYLSDTYTNKDGQQVTRYYINVNSFSFVGKKGDSKTTERTAPTLHEKEQGEGDLPF